MLVKSMAVHSECQANFLGKEETKKVSNTRGAEADSQLTQSTQ